MPSYLPAVRTGVSPPPPWHRLCDSPCPAPERPPRCLPAADQSTTREPAGGVPLPERTRPHGERWGMAPARTRGQNRPHRGGGNPTDTRPCLGGHASALRGAFPPAARARGAKGAARRGARTSLHWGVRECLVRVLDHFATRPRTCQPTAQASVPPRNPSEAAPSACRGACARRQGRGQAGRAHLSPPEYV
jgi:hypothetical protein